MSRILIMLSAASRISLADGSSRPIGFWPEELVEPVRVFGRAGVDVTLATPGGKPAVADSAGFTPEGAGLSAARCDELRRCVDALKSQLDAPHALERLSAESFDAVFVPGGYAPMADLWTNPACGNLLTGFHDTRKPIAAVCHGPVALLSCSTSAGRWPFVGYRMTAFTDIEEKDVGLLDTLPWTAEKALTKQGARFIGASEPWKEHVVRDRHLLTGQNPASANPLAGSLLSALSDGDSRR
ncbi:type 1 glutamine amidotransferase domain-containing protein [Streptomyces violascens]|uniref:type 1 glutamine amidotransferase domain-containing protein n=1 Tax=Streptomyces violascens TaxID=67381 RepID=UPI00364A75A7